LNPDLQDLLLSESGFTGCFFIKIMILVKCLDLKVNNSPDDDYRLAAQNNC